MKNTMFKKSAITAGVVAAMMAGAASAGITKGNVAQNGSAVTASSQWVGKNGSAVSMNDVWYKLGTNYVANDTISFTIEDAKWADTTYYLVNYSNTPAASSASGNIIGMNTQSFSQISKSDTVVTFRVTDATSTSEGNVFRLLRSSSAASNPRANISSMSAGDTASVTVSAKTNTNQDLDTTGTKSFNAFTASSQFSASVTEKLDGTIDVDPSTAANSRLVFVGGGKTDTFKINFLNDDDNKIANEVLINASDTLTVVLSGDSMSGVASISHPAGTSGSVDTTANTATVVIPGSALSVSGTSEVETMTITTNGTTILDPREFTVKADFALKDEGTTDTVVAASTDAGKWGINGLQVKVPYMALNAGFVNFLKVMNEDSKSADITVDAKWSNISQGTTGSKTGAALTAAGAGANLTLGEADLKTALGLNNDDIYHVSLTMTISGPKNSVHVTGWTKDSTGRTMIPVYMDNTGTTTRSWFQ